jgi:hypothetical protein
MKRLLLDPRAGAGLAGIVATIVSGVPGARL